ncbi:HD-GYP domain-containing protein [Egicoccus sp. AB-alg6-2]|uniref:HD-GYP domain-containing protein n=1 Tax=Egicoccus sp. AB-alg6-2 TaxID=3242692 RepID=UPI00359EBFBD
MKGQRRLVTFIAGTATAGLAAVAWAVPQVSLLAACIACLAVLFSEEFASRVRDDVEASLTNVVMLVIIMVGGPSLAVVAAVGGVPSFIRRVTHMRVLRVSFNFGQFAVTALLTGLVFQWIATALDASFIGPAYLLAVVAASIAHSVSNHALVAGVVSIASSERFWGAFRSIGSSLVMQVPYVGIAVLAAVVMQAASPWALLLMAVPTLIARHGLLAFQRLDESYDRLVRGFVKTIEIKDLYTRGHSERVAELSVHVAEELGVPYDQRRLTRYAALLHDVGKVGVPLCIINKPGPLDDDEFGRMKQHPSIGAEILHDIDFLAPAIDIVRFHHERLDGGGYPHGVGGEELTDIVRIVTVVDAFDAMTSTRSYRRALPVTAAVEELRRCANTQFDPRMVEALARVVERIGWEPTTDFASAEHLHGHEIPVGTAEERLVGEPAGPAAPEGLA